MTVEVTSVCNEPIGVSLLALRSENSRWRSCTWTGPHGRSRRGMLLCDAMPSFRVALLLFVSGCSQHQASALLGSDSTVPSDASAASEDEKDGDDVLESGARADTGDTPSGRPATPEILGIYPMGGALHVVWSLNDDGISAVELWRRKDAGAYTLAYTFSDPINNWHDAEASGEATYCFEVRSFRGALGSAPSAERCGSP